MNEVELAWSPVRDWAKEAGIDDFDKKVETMLDKLGRGRSDYMFVGSDLKDSKGPDFRILVVCMNHPANTSDAYYFGTTEDGEKDVLLPKKLLNILKPAT